MKGVNRYNEFKEEDFDAIILKIRNGIIKCGRYSHLVKVDKNPKIEGKELFKNGSKDDKV